MEQNTCKEFDVRQLSARAQRDGFPVFLSATQKRQLCLLPSDGQATLLVLNRNSCVVIALCVRPFSHIATKYVVEPAFDTDEHDGPLSVKCVTDRILRVVVANGIKPNTMIYDEPWNGMDGAHYGMLRKVHCSVRSIGRLLSIDACAVDFEKQDGLGGPVRSLVFLAKQETEVFESKVVRKHHDIIADHNATLLVNSALSDDPIAQAIYDERKVLRQIP